MTVLYIIRQEGTGFVKIGRSGIGLDTRLKNLQVGSPQRHILLGTAFEHHAFNEKYLHDYFRKYHFRGEWFREEGELADFIKNHLPWFVECGRPRRSKDWKAKCAEAFSGQVTGAEPDKYCTRCFTFKDLSQFHKHKAGRPFTYCMVCQRQASVLQRTIKERMKGVSA